MAEPIENAKTLVLLATYNEIENLPLLAAAIRERLPECHILVVDDNSPDGTGDWCRQQCEADERFHCVHREAKLGLGTATFAGMKYAIEYGFDLVATMDADFSHPPEVLPDLIEAASTGAADVAIGSRYVAGGGVAGWPLSRKIMSRLINWYSRVLLWLSVRDCSGAFRCYQTAALARLDFSAMKSHGYSYVEEILVRLKWKGAAFTERPFTFTDRIRGQTKINLGEAIAAVWTIFQLGLMNWLGLGR